MRSVVLLGSRYAMRPNIGFSCGHVWAADSVVSTAVIVQITQREVHSSECVSDIV